MRPGRDKLGIDIGHNKVGSPVHLGPVTPTSRSNWLRSQSPVCGSSSRRVARGKL